MSDLFQNILSTFENEKPTRKGEPTWLQNLRTSNFSEFERKGFPTTKDEEWVHTNVNSALTPPYNLSQVHYPQDLSIPLYAGAPTVRIVLMNGTYRLGRTLGAPLPFGVSIRRLPEVLEKSPDELFSVFGKTSHFSRSAFELANTALFRDGIVIQIAEGVRLTQPIELVHVTVNNGGPSFANPRALIIAKDRSEAHIIERFVGSEKYFTNAVTEVLVGKNATLAHDLLQQQHPEANHVSLLSASIERDGRLISRSIQLGASLSRTDINIRFIGENAKCELNGLFITAGTQHTDVHTRIDHAVAHCASQETYKGIASQSSHGVFDGQILVRPNAQKTDARQISRNLILSESSVIDSTPRLEIFADDVKCAHGATIGSLDDEALFYCQTRGLSQADARQLLTRAFGQEVINTISYEPYRNYVSELVNSRLQEAIA